LPPLVTTFLFMNGCVIRLHSKQALMLNPQQTCHQLQMEVFCYLRLTYISTQGCCWTKQISQNIYTIFKTMVNAQTITNHANTIQVFTRVLLNNVKVQQSLLSSTKLNRWLEKNRSDFVLRPHGLPNWQITRSDRSSDQNMDQTRL